LIGVVGVIGKDGGTNAPSSDGGDWTCPMTGCGAPPYTAAVCCPSWDLLRHKKKNMTRAAAETATRPPATPPAIAPTLEEPPVLDEEDEVEVTAGWEDEVEEEVEAVTVEDETTEDVDIQVPRSMITPGGASGRPEKGSLLIEYD
jgi:hypothetical protein